jgi:hypothetical protein
MPRPSTHTEVCREQAIKFNENWDKLDIEIIQSNIDRLGGTRFYRPAVSKYVAVQGPDSDRVLMYIFKGYLEFPPGLGPDGAHLSTGDYLKGWAYITLSTHMPHRSPKPRSEEPAPDICPECREARSVSGACAC